MEERKSEGGLPEAMIQHIQSFMSGKEAAQTTILSKSWYNAWLTRPNLIFDHRDFNEDEEFSKFSKKTLQRYRDLNLKIDSFKCWIPNGGCRSLANEFAVEVIKMGATDISFKAHQFVSAADVLESKSLIKLFVSGCKMEGVKVNCSTLKYLCLHNVILEGDLFWDIISSCPLIEGLELRQCKCVVNKIKMRLNISKGFELHKLKTLLLERVKICSLFFSDFSSRFPCLKDLSVHKCSGYDKLQIHSQSLEFISLVICQISLKADFDVPNLHKFSLSSGRFLPSISFPNSCNWESNVSISRLDELSGKWFLNLNKLLTNLSLSKVSLNIRCSYLGNKDKVVNTTCLPRPLVENLTIKSSDCATTLLDSLIQWCRPVFVSQYRDPSYSFIDEKAHIESLVSFYKSLMQQKKSVDDLEEVSVQVFDEAVSTEKRIRFHLRWG